MRAQFIEQDGKKKFAVIPYKDFLRMKEKVEDYDDLQALRKAKSEPDYKKRRPYEHVARELGLMS